MKNKKVVYGVLAALAIVGGYMYFKRKRTSAPEESATLPQTKATGSIKELNPNVQPEAAPLVKAVKDNATIGAVITK